MNRDLLRSSAFIRAARRYVKKHPRAAEDIEATLQFLSEDASDPRLKTHKLKGDLDGCWACSASICGRRFSRLKILPRIELLFCGHTKINDRALKELSVAVRLRELWVNNTRVTERGVRRFRRQRWSCEIHTTASY